jgi:hypothetical protein
MTITIAQGDAILRRYANAIGALGERDAHKALARAANHTAKKACTQVRRAVARQTSIPLKIVKKQTRVDQANPNGTGAIEARIVASGRPIPLKAFRPKQFSYGIKVKLMGKTRPMPGTFIFAGTYRSGKEIAGGHVFQRTTVASLPIEKQYGPDVPTQIVKDKAADTFEYVVFTALPQRVGHELGRLLPN